MKSDAELDPETDLELVRVIKAPASLLWDCWTKPEHIVHWFVPRPHKVVECDTDLRPGGRANMVFEVDGNRMDNKGVYLEIVPGRKLVFTDSYTEGWKPSPEPFMTAIVTFDDLGDGTTRYRAIARHRNREAAETHKAMGFFDGWGMVASQLEDYAQGLK